MDMPEWWEQRRFGVLFEPSVAAVAGWAPIGTDAADYRALVEAPMVEVLAHHRDRWAHVARFDDFVDLLDFGDFDPDGWAALAVDAGAGYAATTARHHDGWRWWSARDTDQTTVTRGPRVDAVAAFARSARDRGLVAGVYYSTRADGADGDATAEIADVVSVHDLGFVVVDGEPDPDVTAGIATATPGVVVDIPHPAGSIGPEHVHGHTQLPDRIVGAPWQLRWPLGSGHGYNRADGPAQVLDADCIVALLTEVVAKGGHLLLGVAVDGDGAVVADQASALRDAGRWIASHRRLVDHGRPWREWGDDEVRYVLVDDTLHAVDVACRGRFAALGRAAVRVTDVRLGGSPVAFTQDDEALHVDAPRPVRDRRRSIGRTPGPAAAVYEIDVADVDAPAALFPPASTAPIDLAPVLADAAPGSVVQLGDGTYRGPADVPDGVTVRGLGSGRTRLLLDGDEALTAGTDARLEHLAIGPLRPDPFGSRGARVELRGDRGVVLGCVVDGTIVARGDDVVVRASDVAHVVGDDAERVTVTRCRAYGATGTAIRIGGGSGHVIESCEVAGHDHAVHDHAVHLVDTSAVTVRANELRARRAGVWVERSDACRVQANFVKGSGRGIDVDGGAGTVVDGNAVCDGDSGAVVRGGATATVVTGNTWERCRIGVLTWDVDDVQLTANDGIDLADAELVTGR